MEEDHVSGGIQNQKKNLIIPVAFFMILGMMNSISVKLAMEVEVAGRNGIVHNFQKPWFLTTLAFVGMAFATIIYHIMSLKKADIPRIKDVVTWKIFFEYSIPAISDIFQGVISAVTVAFVGVSIDVMMKSGTLIGICLITRFVFKRHLPWYKWISSFIVIGALVVVGMAPIINAGVSQTIHISKGWVAFIVVLKLFSQVGYAIKICYEEYFSQTRGHHPVLIVGLEGIWSTIICCCILMPIVQFIPSEEGNGIHEDIIDTFIQIKNSWLLITIVIVSILLGLSYNIVSVQLTERTSALVRSLIEGVRTFLLWLIQLGLFYWFSSTVSLFQYREVGEEWCTGSYIQLAGYFILIFGIIQYRGYPRFPCLNYHDHEEEEQKQLEHYLVEEDDNLAYLQ